MDFDFSEEQYSFRESIRGFLVDRQATIGPGIIRRSGALADDFWSGLADLGTFSALVPEQYGGLGLNFVDLSLVLEEFGRELVPPLAIDTLIATDLIARYGSEEQKSKLLPQIAAGSMRISNALAEADSGYDPTDMATRSVRTGQGERLSGKKIMVPDARGADLLLINARFDGERGLGLVLLDRERAGVKIREHQTFDLASAYHEVSFENVAIASSDLLGTAPCAPAVLRLMDACAVAAATFMTGIAGKVMDTAVAYVKQRNQFGKPIGSFQAIKHKCADMAVGVDSCRSAVYYAAWALAGETEDQPKAVSIAKSFCGDTSRFVCNEGIQLHGGMGFTWDVVLHHYLRRAKLLEYSYGDAAYHRRRVVSEALRELAAH